MGEKYPILEPRELIRALESIGFNYKSRKGSHVKYTDGVHTVIIPMHDTIARGTLRSILHQAGIELEHLMNLL
ncbi:MAG: type II toxin-antitoxin system HicA family toxin [Clostridiales Family XIII bacterium]|jgi:predicted RNA binding protein YcfA (HicA-like mRNA interferase family)|nr:type II toxin-antitoxin system HicA family toxin [Clostridiales Family XIII bacterium]